MMGIEWQVNTIIGGITVMTHAYVQPVHYFIMTMYMYVAACELQVGMH